MCVVPPLVPCVCRRFILRFDAHAPSSLVLVPRTMCSPCAHHPTPPVVSRYSIISLLIPLLPLPLQLRPRDGPSLSVDPKLCRVPQPQVFLYVRLLRGLASLPTPPLLHASRVTHRAAARQSVLSPTCVRRGPRASIPVHRPEGCSGRCSRRAPRRCPQMLPLCFIIQGHHRGASFRGIIQGRTASSASYQCFIRGGRCQRSTFLPLWGVLNPRASVYCWAQCFQCSTMRVLVYIRRRFERSVRWPP